MAQDGAEDSGPGEAPALEPAPMLLAAEVFGAQPEARMLLVGDGNFSFAEALLRLEVAGCQLVATAYETEAELEAAGFRDVFERAERLRARGMAVGMGVDATNLTDTLPADVMGPFDVIVFQFPQHPERRKIHLQRQLLRGFFASAVGQLAPEGSIVVSLCRGQGGTPAEEEPRKTSDTWQVQDAAAELGLLLRLVQPCPTEELELLGYRSTGYRCRGLRPSNADNMQDKSFNWDGSLTHVFCRDSIGAVAAYALVWSHDVSLWEPDGFEEEHLQVALRAAVCGEGGDASDGVEVTLELMDQYCRPEDGKRARTYRLTVRAQRRAVSQAAWRRACEGVSKQFSDAADRAQSVSLGALAGGAETVGRASG